jgi:hypothetical protein
MVKLIFLVKEPHKEVEHNNNDEDLDANEDVMQELSSLYE